MDAREIIDAQFDKAVEVVQNLPSTGPIQTGYEAKLKMYGLYKQATVGNVQTPRPGMLEMLHRAKWDAWAKYKDLDPYEAKVLYIEALLKVLRRYSDKTVAMDIVRELESIGGDPSNLVMSGSLTRSRSSSSSSSSSGVAGPSGSHYSSDMPAHLRNNVTNPMYMSHPPPEPRSIHSEEFAISEGEAEDEVHQPLPNLPQARSHMSRPQSSLSSHKYRTPAASMMMSPPPTSMSVPPTQPRPLTAISSVYAEHNSTIPTSTYPPSVSSFPGGFHPALPRSPPQHDPYNVQPPYHSTSQLPYPVRQHSLASVTARPVLERAVENVQAHLAALNERIESLENAHHHSTTSVVSHNGSRSPQWRGHARGGSSPIGGVGPDAWDIDDMGMWSLVLRPLFKVQARFRQLMDFIMYNDNRSPTFVVIRRLFLDISFLLCLLAVVKVAWSRSGMRRREVLSALQGLWYAIVGRKRPRVMVDGGV